MQGFKLVLFVMQATAARRLVKSAARKKAEGKKQVSSSLSPLFV